METISDVVGAVSVDEIGKHIRALEGIRHPVVAPAALDRAEHYVREVLERQSYNLGEHRFNDDGRTFSNVIATRTGTRFPDERVLVVAHFDTVQASPGADDNASGVAVLLESARVLSSLQFERTIHFVGMNLEEYPAEDYVGSALRGSRAFTAFAKEEGWNIRGVVVLEAVAFAGDYKQGVPPIPINAPETGDFIGVVGNQNSGDLVMSFTRVIEKYGIRLPFFPLVVPGNGEFAPDTRRSDHAPFWDQGYKAIMLTDTANFRNPHYHQPSDTIETLNLPFAAEVCRATTAFVAELAGPLS